MQLFVIPQASIKMLFELLTAAALLSYAAYMDNSSSLLLKLIAWRDNKVSNAKFVSNLAN